MQERQEKIVRAEGEAKAAMLLGQALKKNPGYLKLRKIRAAQAIAYTVSSGSYISLEQWGCLYSVA